MSETLASTRRTKDKKRRKKLRDKLRAEGASEALIEKIIDRQRFQDLVARVGLERATYLANTQAHRQDPDDAGYQPSIGDSLLRGPAHVGGITAKVVRRRDTITRFQYDKATEMIQEGSVKVWWCEVHENAGPNDVLCNDAMFNSNFGPEDGRCRMVEMQLVPIALLETP